MNLLNPYERLYSLPVVVAQGSGQVGCANVNNAEMVILWSETPKENKRWSNITFPKLVCVAHCPWESCPAAKRRLVDSFNPTPHMRTGISLEKRRYTEIFSAYGI